MTMATVRAKLEKWLTKKWYQREFSFALLPLLPLSWLFYFLQMVRKIAYQKSWLPSYAVSVPVIVVGNITLGGNGKTAFVIWLAKWLQQKGFKPGIILRGVGASQNRTPTLISENDDPKEMGDEAILLARQTKLPVVIGKARVEAAKHLINTNPCDIIISDDGLQHYRLKRNIEFLLIDEMRQFGNQKLIPAGPLREPLSRITSTDFVITRGNNAENAIHYKPLHFVNIKDNQLIKPLDFFTGVDANVVTAIGNPYQFIHLLSSLKIKSHAKFFPDHHQYQQTDFDLQHHHFPLIMTAKDAVKCQTLVNDNAWYLEIETIVSDALQNKIAAKLLSINPPLTNKDMICSDA